MAGELGKNMTMDKFVDLTRFIMAEHTFGLRGHMIKYIRPHFDTRTGDFYGVSFDGMFGHKDFFVVNENRNRDLLPWIMDFLSTEPQKAGWEPRWEPHNTVSETTKI
jgi:hypothetical protein